MGLRGPKPKRGVVVWSPKLAYAVGLIASDGSLSVSGRHIDLTSKDREQLLNFMGCIDKEVKISMKAPRYGSEGIARIQFSDVVLYNFFLSIGLTPRKSLTIGALDIPDKLFFDFLRGSFDGDGCFYSYFDPRWKNSFMFYLNFVSASEKHMQWIQETVERLCGAGGHRVFTGRVGHKIHSLRYAKKATLKLLKLMYPNTKAVSLSRKRLKIEKALRIVGECLPKA